MLELLVRKTETLEAKDTLGCAVSRLDEKKALPVVNKSYLGMLYLRDMVIRDIDTNTKIESLVQNARKLKNDDSEDELISSFMEYPVLPFFEKEKLKGVVDSVDFLESLDIKGRACDFADETEIISHTETLGIVRNRLRECEVLLVEEEGKIIGGIDIFSFSKQIIPKFGIGAFSQRRDTSTKIYGTSVGEKIDEKEIKVRPVETEAINAEPDEEISEVIKKLKEHTFLVCGDKVITTKTILRKLKELRGDKVIPNLDLVGFDLEEGIYTDVLYKEIRKFAEKTNKIIKPIEIKFHLRKLRSTGVPLYELDGKVLAGGKAIVANVTGHGIMDLVQEVIDKLDTQVIKMHKL